MAKALESKIGEKGEVSFTLPPDFIARLGLKAGDSLAMEDVAGGVMIVKPAKLTRDRAAAMLEQVFAEIDRKKDISLRVDSDEEALKIANQEIAAARAERRK